MQFTLAPLLLAMAALVVANPVLETRQDGCEVYGDYPEYTGPCEMTNCGASGRNCDTAGYSGCVVYPSFLCPPKGCACTNY